jgi:protein-S-isoprenylcysteine O-methyltransferase Ste14
MNADSDSPRIATLPPLIYLAFFLLGLALDYLHPLPFLSQGLQYASGAAAIALGGALAIPSLVLFRRAGTNVDVRKPATAIVSEGPYRVTRNPMYLGLLLVYVGAGLMTDSIWIVALAIPLVAIVSTAVIAREERYLERKFGDQYRRYKQQVRRWI